MRSSNVRRPSRQGPPEIRKRPAMWGPRDEAHPLDKSWLECRRCMRLPTGQSSGSAVPATADGGRLHCSSRRRCGARPKRLPGHVCVTQRRAFWRRQICAPPARAGSREKPHRQSLPIRGKQKPLAAPRFHCWWIGLAALRRRTKPNNPSRQQIATPARVAHDLLVRSIARAM